MKVPFVFIDFFLFRFKYCLHLFASVEKNVSFSCKIRDEKFNEIATEQMNAGEHSFATKYPKLM